MKTSMFSARAVGFGSNSSGNHPRSPLYLAYVSPQLLNAKLFAVVLTALMCFNMNVFAQAWQPVGPDEYNRSLAADEGGLGSAAIDAAGVIYLVSGGSRLRVKKYIAGEWLSMSSPPISSSAHFSDMALDPGGSPYVVYQIPGNYYNDRVEVKKFDGNSWERVGSLHFPFASPDKAEYTSIAIDSSGTPYIIYRDEGDSNKASVRKFNGSVWVDVGQRGFSSGAVRFTDIAIGPGGELYAAYQDEDQNDRITVKKFNGVQWETLGSAGFSGGKTLIICIEVDAMGIPYVAYRQGNGNNIHAYVKKFVGGNWMDVGLNGLAAVKTDDLSLALDSSGTPYLAVRSLGETQISVRKFEAGAWVVVGPTKFSANGISNPKMLIGPSQEPYVAYTDLATGRATVKKLQGNTWSTLGGENFAEGADHTALSFSSAGVLYAAYSVGSFENHSLVKKFNGSEWDSVGPDRIRSQGKVALAVNAMGIPYVAFGDRTASDKVSVQRFNGSVWEYVGNSGFSEQHTFKLSLAFDSLGIPYVAYLYNDPIYSYHVKVKKYTGSSWDEVASLDFIAVLTTQLSMLIDQNGDLILVYSYQSASAPTYRVRVLQFQGGTWHNLGSIFTDATDPSAALGPDNILHLAYRDAAIDKVRVKKYTGGSWTDVGTPGFSAGDIENIQLAIGPSGVPFVGYKDLANAEKLSVQKWDGITWEYVGDPGFTVGPSNELSMAISPEGFPHVFYTNLGGWVYKYPVAADTLGDNVTLTSDTSWRRSTYIHTANADRAHWPGVEGMLPATATYTLPVQTGNRVLQVEGTEPINSESGVRFYRKTFNLNTATGAAARIRAYMDDGMEIYLNGYLLAREDDRDVENKKGAAHDLMFFANGTYENGFQAGDLFDYVRHYRLDSLLQPGENEVVIALQNKNGVDNGGFSFRMDLETSLPVVPELEDYIVSDIKWRKSTVITPTPNWVANWSGVGSLPADNTFSLPVEIGSNVFPVDAAQSIKAPGNISYYRRSFFLEDSLDISAHIRATFDEMAEIYLNGHLLVRANDLDANNRKLPAHSILYQADSSVVNGYNGGDSFEPVVSATLDTILRSGENTVIVVVRKRPSGEGGFSFRMDLEKNGSPVIVKKAAGSHKGIASELQVYPNPANDHLMVEIPSSAWPGSIMLYDLNGRLLLQKSVTASREGQILQIAISQYASGIYVLHYRSGNQHRSVKFFKR